MFDSIDCYLMHSKLEQSQFLKTFMPFSLTDISWNSSKEAIFAVSPTFVIIVNCNRAAHSIPIVFPLGDSDTVAYPKTEIWMVYALWG